MKRAPNWTLNEFEILISNYKLPTDELVKLLPKRSIGAVEVVRQGLHSYHRGQNISMLSKMMVRKLEDNIGKMICPICGIKF